MLHTVETHDVRHTVAHEKGIEASDPRVCGHLSEVQLRNLAKVSRDFAKMCQADHKVGWAADAINRANRYEEIAQKALNKSGLQ